MQRVTWTNYQRPGPCATAPADGPVLVEYNAPSMQAWVRKWWPLLKVLLTVAILGAIGWGFARELQSPDLWQRSFHPGWLVVSGLVYLGGLGFSAFFWHRLLRALGQQP